MDADELYGLALDRFVTERAALAKALRASGQRDEAARVAALRRPSIAAWAVNQLVRTQRADVQELFDAGDALQAAQSDLLAGSGDGRTLRAAGERERAAVAALVGTARGLLTTQGADLSDTTIERVSDTLHAAALDEAARKEVREGRLERELRHVGLGIGDSAAALFAAEPPARGKARAKRTSAKRGASGKRAQGSTDVDGGHAEPTGGQAETAREQRAREVRERDEAEHAERERAAARTAARAARTKAERRAQSAARAVARAEERRAEAAEALAAADEALVEARADSALATEELERAQAALERGLHGS